MIGMFEGPLALFCGFVVMHALADFPLQGDYLARHKVRKNNTAISDWLIALCSHSVIQAGGVWLVSGSVLFGITEFVLHGLIDIGKGEGKYGVVMDQSLHLLCKISYVVLLTYVFARPLISPS